MKVGIRFTPELLTSLFTQDNVVHFKVLHGIPFEILKPYVQEEL